MATLTQSIIPLVGSNYFQARHSNAQVKGSKHLVSECYFSRLQLVLPSCLQKLKDGFQPLWTQSRPTTRRKIFREYERKGHDLSTWLFIRSTYNISCTMRIAEIPCRDTVSHNGLRPSILGRTSDSTFFTSSRKKRNKRTRKKKTTTNRQ